MQHKQLLDSKGNDLNQLCEALINSSLLKYLQDINEGNFPALNSFLDMMMTWVKLFNQGASFIFKKEAKLMENIYRIPNVRKGLIVKTLQWMVNGFM
jgi:hypothetical protein